MGEKTANRGDRVEGTLIVQIALPFLLIGLEPIYVNNIFPKSEEIPAKDIQLPLLIIYFWPPDAKVWARSRLG